MLIDDIIVPRVVRHDADLFALRDSIKRLGVINPIVVDKRNRVIIGAKRVVAAKLAGLKEIPSVFIDENRVFSDKDRVLASILSSEPVSPHKFKQMLLKALENMSITELSIKTGIAIKLIKEKLN